MPMAASMSLPSTLTSKRPIYFRCLLTLAVLIWPLGVLGQVLGGEAGPGRLGGAGLGGGLLLRDEHLEQHELGVESLRHVGGPVDGATGALGAIGGHQDALHQ